MSVALAVFNGLAPWLPARGFFEARRRWLRLAGIDVGAGVRIAMAARFYDRYITIGDGTWIGPEVSLFSTRVGRIAVGARVDIGPRVLIVSGTHDIGDGTRRAGAASGEDISVGNGTWIGANSTLLAGARIGCGSIVAAGSVVLRGEYPPNVLLAGVPAQPRHALSR